MPELQSALEKSGQATQDLVLKLIQKDSSSHISQDAALKQYQKTQSEVRFSYTVALGLHLM